MSGLEIPIAALAVGTGASMVGKEMAGVEQSRAAAFEQQQYEVQAQQNRTAAARDEATRRTELESSIDNIMALRAGRGVGQASPTANAIFGDITQRAETDIETAKTNLLTRANQGEQAAQMAQRRKRMALIAGDIGALGDLGGAAFKFGSTKYYKPGVTS